MGNDNTRFVRTVYLGEPRDGDVKAWRRTIDEKAIGVVLICLFALFLEAFKFFV